MKGRKNFRGVLEKAVTIIKGDLLFDVIVSL
jgi:hypothetical protein